jgi:ClpP class serine protease
VWSAEEAKALGLVDDLMTSEELLQSRMATHDVLLVKPATQPKQWSLFSRPMGPSFSSKKGVGFNSHGGVKGVAREVATAVLEVLAEAMGVQAQQAEFIV